MELEIGVGQSNGAFGVEVQLFAIGRTERRQRTPGSGIPCPLGLLRMPSRLAVWVDLASDTCTLLAPVAMRWAWALLMAFATGAVTVR